MIVDNKLYFGYGDIAVGSNPFTREIVFQAIKPPQEIGSPIVDTEFTNDELVLSINGFDEYDELANKLNSIKSATTKEFEFRGLVFNFEANNNESVDVVIKHANRALSGYLMCAAC